MKIEDTFHVKNRGTLAFVQLDCDPPKVFCDRMRRTSDGATWEVQGIEYFLKRPPEKGDKVGLLLIGEAFFAQGDDIVLDEVDAVAYDASGKPIACPSEKCPMCTGEMCALCGAGCSPTNLDRPKCEHDVLERHRERY